MNRILSLAAILSSLLFAGCAGIALTTAVATSITGVSEVAASDALQHNALTLAQLDTLTQDLAKLPQTPLPSTDNDLIANIIVELKSHKQANLTQASVVDAVNNAINSLNAATSNSPNALQGVLWSYLQDVVGGLKQAVTHAKNFAPSTALYSRPERTPNDAILAEVWKR